MSYRQFHMQAINQADRILSGEFKQEKEVKSAAREQRGLVRKQKMVNAAEDTTEELDSVAKSQNSVLKYLLPIREDNMKLEEGVKVASTSNEELIDMAESAPVQISADAEDVGVRLVGDLEEALGISQVQAAAIVGNLAHETSDFKFMQELEPVVKGSRGGYGFAQWTGSRRKDFESWASENDLDLNSYEANFGFLMHEIQNTREGRFLEKLEATDNIEDATRVVSEGYLRPGKPMMSSRIKYSKKYFSTDQSNGLMSR